MNNQPDAVKIKSMFDAISSGYDRANTTLSFGIHHLWRKKLVVWSGVRSGMNVLDCATGTGDLAIAFKKIVGKKGKVIGADFSPSMLTLATEKVYKKGMTIPFEEADVMKLQYSNDSFDITSIAFGIRNVADPLKGLQELARVTKPGGVVMILEFGQPTFPIWKECYQLYSKHLLPKLGGMLTGKRDAYEYLRNSSEHFPCREKFVELMYATKMFPSAEYRSLTGGVAYMYKGMVKT